MTRYGFTTGPDDPRHGTPNAYSNLECRCDECRTAMRTYRPARDAHARYRARKRQERIAAGWQPRPGPETAMHGELRMYRRGCHCVECRAAAAARRRHHRQAT